MAEPTPPTNPKPFDWQNMASNWGANVLLGWFFWQTITTTLPGMQKSFHDQVDKEREVFRVELREQRSHYEKQGREMATVVADLAQEVRKIAVAKGN